MTGLGGIASERNVGAGLAVGGGVAGEATAGGAGDGAEITGEEFDRLPNPTGDTANRFDSCVVTAAMRATLAATETATLSFSIEEATTSGGSFSALAAALQPPDLVLTGGGGGTTEIGTLKHNLKLSPRERILRLKTTVTMSAAVTDIASYGANIVAGGATPVPAT